MALQVPLATTISNYFSSRQTKARGGASRAAGGALANIPAGALDNRDVYAWHNDFCETANYDTTNDYTVTDTGTSSTTRIVIADPKIRINTGVTVSTGGNVVNSQVGIVPSANSVISFDAQITLSNWTTAHWLVGIGQHDAAQAPLIANGVLNTNLGAVIGVRWISTDATTGSFSPAMRINGTNQSVTPLTTPTLTAGESVHFSVRIVGQTSVYLYINDILHATYESSVNIILKHCPMFAAITRAASAATVTMDAHYLTYGGTRS
jgi:hypothetical protein